MTSKDKNDLLALRALLQIRSNNAANDPPLVAPNIPTPMPNVSPDLASFIAANSPAPSQVAAMQAAAVRAAVNAELQANISAALAGNRLLPATTLHQPLSAFSPGSIEAAVALGGSAALTGLSPERLSQHAHSSSGHREPAPGQDDSEERKAQLREQTLKRAGSSSPVAPRTNTDVDDSSTNGSGVYKTESGNEDAQTDENRPLVRRDQIEAALRSKPQRGRKRDNLNSLERMELTRTRNREHAKSTRLRKKARYQELLDCEEKLLGLERSKEIVARRRYAVTDFVDARASMFHCLLEETVPLRSSSDSSHAGNSIVNTPVSPRADEAESDGRQLRRRQRLVSDGDLSEELANSRDEQFPDALKEFIENCDEFQFDMVGQIDDQVSLSSGQSSAVAKMNKFDAKIGAFVMRHYGQNALGELEYVITGGSDGIAVNNDGSAFAHVDLNVFTNRDGKKQDDNEKGGSEENENERHRTTLLSLILSIRFAPESDRIRALQCCVTKNFMSTLAAAQESSLNQSGCRVSGSDETFYAIPVRF